MLELDRVSSGDFSPLLHGLFRLTAGELSLDLELVEVNDSGRKSTTQERAPFSILFKGTREKLVPQQMYRVEHETLGAMDLFIVPVREDKDGYYYEAVFS
jgi:hypothetical protein